MDRVTISDLKPGMCVFPIGDPTDWDTFGYCGEAVRFDELGTPHKSYCRVHFELCYSQESRERVSGNKAREVRMRAYRQARFMAEAAE